MKWADHWAWHWELQKGGRLAAWTAVSTAVWMADCSASQKAGQRAIQQAADWAAKMACLPVVLWAAHWAAWMVHQKASMLAARTADLKVGTLAGYLAECSAPQLVVSKAALMGGSAVAGWELYLAAMLAVGKDARKAVQTAVSTG